MLKLFSIIVCIFLLTSCVTNSWNDEYFLIDESEGHYELDCNNEQATKIASSAINNQYPIHFKKFKKKGFSIWEPTYGEINGESQWHYTYKTILGYKEIQHHKYGGSYYEESIEVSLSQNCDVLDVSYFKGKIEYVE